MKTYHMIYGGLYYYKSTRGKTVPVLYIGNKKEHPYYFKYKFYGTNAKIYFLSMHQVHERIWETC